MFKFLKSKKGFTLVELMIVVVIMAILVAVAVPIYSAVTANAKKKTCVANMREIVSQINNYAMSEGKSYNFSFDISGGEDVKAGTVTNVAGSVQIEASTLSKMFQVVPYCPAGGTYSVEVGAAGTASTEAGGVTVKVTCGSNIEGHEYGTNA